MIIPAAYRRFCNAAAGYPCTAHPEIFVERFWGEQRRFIGIPFRRSYLESLGAEFKLSKEMVELAPEIYLTGEIPRRTSFEIGDTGMVAVYDDGNEKQPDPLNDDYSLVVKTTKGLVVVLGCAHAGMVNILDYVKDKFPGEKIFSVFGGTHMGFSDDKQFNETMKVIDHYEIENLGVSFSC